MTFQPFSFKPQPKNPIRTLAHVHFYEGNDADIILRDLIHADFTGPVTLNISVGRVRSIEWREKVRPESAPQNSP